MNTEDKKSFSGKGIFPHQWAFTLLIPIRNLFLSPKTLIKRLQLEAAMQVLEVGCGPGYFSLHVARQLSQGSIVLADIQQEMLDYAKKRLSRKKITNSHYYLCDGDRFKLADNHFDRIFMVTVIGEVKHQDAYMQEFFRMLKPNGILSFSEQAGDPDKMESETIRKLAEKHGFTFMERFGDHKNYTINFTKKES